MGSGKAGSARAVAIGLGGVTIAFVLVVPWLSWWKLLGLLTLATLSLTTAFVIFLVTRHLGLVRRRRQHPVVWKRPRGNTEPSRKTDGDYYLFVLGSGGHTKEMLMMMDDGFCDFSHVHRRYLVSSGDTMSLNHLQDYEAELEQLCEKNESDPGTHDVRTVTRARRVHQSILTVPLSGLASLYDIVFNVLLSPPANDTGKKLQYPRMIFSNGPATGFFVGLAVHLLKMVYIIPEDRCFFVYIESWARISTLSLTGKLFHYTGVADGLAVQHQEVATKYGIENAGPMVFNSRRETGTGTDS